MLNAFGISEVARTGQPARIGSRVVTIDDIVRRTTSTDWIGGDWVELTPIAAARLAERIPGTLLDEPRALPAAPRQIEGELVSIDG